jgi:type II protein arginine methyltransferase
MLDLSKFPEDIANMIRAIEAKPDFPERLARLALLLKRGKKLSYLAPELALQARSLAPEDPRVRYLTYHAVRKSAPGWHFSIVQDTLRNAIYARALNRFVRPGMLVLEIGAGTGLLAMLAAKAGAAQVITCEKEPLVAERAQAIIACNGLADRVTVVPKDLMALAVGDGLPRRADLLVAEIVDNYLLGESALSLYNHACKHLLTPEARVLPATIAARGMLVGGLETKAFRMGEVLGFDLSPFNTLSPPTVTNGDGGGLFEAYSDPVEIFSFDLSALRHPDREHRKLEIAATRSGLAQGFMQWNWMDFGGGITFENRPPLKSCWWPIIHTFPEALAVNQGDCIRLHAEHDQANILIWPMRSEGAYAITGQGA